MRRHTKAPRKRGGRKHRKRLVTLSEPVAANEVYLDKVAVARRLGVKPKTVGQWANQGKLPAYRIGSYLRFKWAEVEQHLAATARVCPSTQTSNQPVPRSDETRLQRKEI